MPPEGDANPLLRIENLGVQYSRQKVELKVIQDLSLSIKEGKFVSIVGPSGCGKTTLLRCIGGLQRPTKGQVLVMGKNISQPIDEMTLVFQEYNRSLFPWRTVIRNVMLPVEDKMKKSDAQSLALRLIQSVGLIGFENYYPWQLSGGMQQRVAIARALAPDPKIILMDEPFAAVDAQTRMALEDQILKIWHDLNLTVLFVTHDIDEAIYLSQTVIVLNGRPARISEEVQVDLEYPRNQIITRGKEAFASYRSKIYEALRTVEK